MTTLRSHKGVTLVRPDKGDLLVVNHREPDLLTVIPDPTGKLGEIMRVCAARDRRRNEENG